MSLIALDSMVFIYFFEKREPFAKPARDIIELFETGKTFAVTSVISVIESLSAVKLQKMPVLSDDMRAFFRTASNLTIRVVDWAITLQTATLRQRYPKLHTPDAIQLATAAEAKADVFITNDAKLLHLSKPPVPIVSMTRFVSKYL